MLLSEFEAVVYEGEVYCTGCLPRGIDTDHEEVRPIFAGDEVDGEQVCCECGAVHDYMDIRNQDEGDILSELDIDPNEMIEPLREQDSDGEYI